VGDRESLRDLGVIAHDKPLEYSVASRKGRLWVRNDRPENLKTIVTMLFQSVVPKRTNPSERSRVHIFSFTPQPRFLRSVPEFFEGQYGRSTCWQSLICTTLLPFGSCGTLVRYLLTEVAHCRRSIGERTVRRRRFGSTTRLSRLDSVLDSLFGCRSRHFRRGMLGG